MRGIDDLETVTFATGDVILERGLADRGHIIHKGIIHKGVVGLTPSHAALVGIFGTPRPGDYVSEMASVDNKPLLAAAIMGEETSCAAIAKEELDTDPSQSDLPVCALDNVLTHQLRKRAERRASSG